MPNKFDYSFMCGWLTITVKNWLFLVIFSLEFALGLEYMDKRKLAKMKVNDTSVASFYIKVCLLIFFVENFAFTFLSKCLK